MPLPLGYRRPKPGGSTYAVQQNLDHGCIHFSETDEQSKRTISEKLANRADNVDFKNRVAVPNIQ
jgi:hypothetical protein